ncbi:(Fe-S)-binding protein [Caldinitratiruptor microaerophilus]|uniref:Glycolate oxidase iron-sulfur subunit n=1 Tax=Caldinitratiruptor microaerophilus TaxID=671077 RepID=A0AA35G900_9FIRM|nr:(Fe-S)-binding protein [Caldinitratiruptor microaerophilus]BDG60948.1 glycolate oxidase iron-sulfur subunit [Caldinitratiruptor microaerophilus]
MAEPEREVALQPAPPADPGGAAAAGRGAGAAAGPLAVLLAAEYDEALRCVKCGFCLEACPTYRQTGLEPASPRGRLALVRALVEGTLGPDAVAGPLDLCLGCRACETACPSGIRYGRVLEGARSAIAPSLARRRSRLGRLLQRLALRHLLPHRGRLRAAVRLASAARPLLRRATGLVPAHLRELGLSMPPAPDRRLWAEWERLLRPLPDGSGWVVPAQGRRRHRVAFFPGCIQDALYLEVNLATVRVLSRTGCEVVIPAAATCCGALHAHSGDREAARRLARQNVEAFGRLGPVDAIVNAAGGCGAHLKEYGHLLPDDPAAAAFAARVRDLSEWLAEHGLGDATLRPLPLTVTYQDSCHLAHGQGVRAQPRQLLRAIPGLRFVEMEEADRCCGSAGIYNLLQPAMAGAVLDEKMSHAAATGARVIVVANPGCHLQMAHGVRTHGLGAEVEVLHLAQVLDRALTDTPRE